MIRPSFALTAKIWRIYANCAGFVLLAGGLSWLIVLAAAENGPVFVASDVRPIITRAKPGGLIVYVYDQERFSPCAGEVTETFSQVESEGGIYEQRRHVVFTQPKFYNDLEIKIHVPIDLRPGRYRFQDGIFSRCPTYSRYDKIAEFDVEIIPSENIAGP